MAAAAAQGPALTATEAGWADEEEVALAMVMALPAVADSAVRAVVMEERRAFAGLGTTQAQPRLRFAHSPTPAKTRSSGHCTARRRSRAKT